jgi:glycogen(starch) synthase
MPAVESEQLAFDVPRLLCLGRIVDEKGFDLALEAFASLVDRFPEARLVIAGDGPARAGLEYRATLLGLVDTVEFIGWVAPEKVPELINTTSVVVIPSRWREPFCLVALQAAQMARPVVATRVGGLPEIVVHGQTGLLVERENSSAIAEAIAFLLEHPDVAAQMGRDARSRARDVFSWERFVDSYDALYRRLIRHADCVDSTNPSCES